MSDDFWKVVVRQTAWGPVTLADQLRSAVFCTDNWVEHGREGDVDRLLPLISGEGYPISDPTLDPWLPELGALALAIAMFFDKRPGREPAWSLVTERLKKVVPLPEDAAGFLLSGSAIAAMDGAVEACRVCAGTALRLALPDLANKPMVEPYAGDIRLRMSSAATSAIANASAACCWLAYAKSMTGSFREVVELCDVVHEYSKVDSAIFQAALIRTRAAAYSGNFVLAFEYLDRVEKAVTDEDTDNQYRLTKALLQGQLGIPIAEEGDIETGVKKMFIGASNGDASAANNAANNLMYLINDMCSFLIPPDIFDIQENFAVSTGYQELVEAVTNDDVDMYFKTIGKALKTSNTTLAVHAMTGLLRVNEIGRAHV